MRHAQRYHRGDPVVFRMPKRSSSPGPRAAKIDPEPHGEDYRYYVDKYWTVAETRDDGQLVLRTRRGKTHVLDPEHPELRPANLWERLFKKKRFPRLDQLPVVSSQ